MKEKKKSLDDIVFEKKNKNYGAYVFRKISDKVLLVSFVIGSIIFLVIIASLFFISTNGGEFTKAKISDDNSEMVEVDITPPKEPEEEEPIEEKPVSTTKEQQSMVKNIEPTIKEEVKNKEETLADKKDLEESVSSTEDIDGKKDASDTDSEKGKKGEQGNTGDKVEEDPNIIYSNVDVKAKFRGGYYVLKKYISSNLIYPKKAIRNNKRGEVEVKFLVERDGTITQLSIVSKPTIGFGLEEEAIRVVKMTSGKWIPAERAGKKVRTYFIIPITFILN